MSRSVRASVDPLPRGGAIGSRVALAAAPRSANGACGTAVVVIFHPVVANAPSVSSHSRGWASAVASASSSWRTLGSVRCHRAAVLARPGISRTHDEPATSARRSGSGGITSSLNVTF